MNSPNYDALYQLAEQVSDFEKLRISLDNRLRQCSETFNPVLLSKIEAPIELVEKAEAIAIKELEANLKTTFWGKWLKSPASKGVGAKTLARLLGVIQDPFWHYAEDRPRRLVELWAYCGLHIVEGAAPKRKRGVQANWSEEARKRVWLIATACVKVGAGGPYRAVYDEWRTKYADATHKDACVRCGPSGKPAQPGSPLSLG